MKPKFFFAAAALLIFFKSSAFATEPTAKQLELMFGIEEELRSPLILTTYLTSRTALTTAPITLGNPHLMPFGLIGGYLGAHAATGVSIDFTIKKFAKNIIKLCSEHPELNCIEGDGHKIMFLDQSGNTVGWLKPKYDLAVIEVVGSPIKIADLDSHMGKALQLTLFDATKKTGLYPAKTGGEGHLHIDFNSLFQKGTPEKPNWDYRLFRNYAVDWANHNELYYGALHYDPIDLAAKPLLRSEQTRNAFLKWLEEFDGELKNGSIDDQKFMKYIHRLGNECGFRKGFALNVIPKIETGPKAIDLNLHMPKTIEVRSLKPKKTFGHLGSTMKLLQGRAEYLRNLDGLLPYHQPAAIQNAQEGVDRFYRYVKESNLDYDEIKKLLPETWQKKTPRTLSDAELFKPGSLKPNAKFRCMTWMNAHLFGK